MTEKEVLILGLTNTTKDLILDKLALNTLLKDKEPKHNLIERASVRVVSDYTMIKHYKQRLRDIEENKCEDIDNPKKAIAKIKLGLYGGLYE